MTPLSHLGRALAERNGHPAPSLRKLRELVQRAIIDGESINGRWYFDESRIDQIAAAVDRLTPRRRSIVTI